MRFLVLLLAVLPSVAVAGPFSFKEFKLDTTREELTAARPGMNCRDGPLPLADHSCSLAYETIAEKEVKLLTVGFYDGRTSSIRLLIGQTDFAAVVAALSERYGPPASAKTEHYSNQLGVTFERRRLRWNGDRSLIEADEYGGRVDRSTVEFRMNDWIDKFKTRRDRQRSGATKDL